MMIQVSIAGFRRTNDSDVPGSHRSTGLATPLCGYDAGQITCIASSYTPAMGSTRAKSAAVGAVPPKRPTAA